MDTTNKGGSMRLTIVIAALMAGSFAVGMASSHEFRDKSQYENPYEITFQAFSDHDRAVCRADRNCMDVNVDDN